MRNIWGVSLAHISTLVLGYNQAGTLLQRYLHIFLTCCKTHIILDFLHNTGSGVLALAALHLGASAAVGVDTDSLAVRAARRNAQLNGVENRLAVLQCGPSLEEREPLQQVRVTCGLHSETA
jgi:ribosomal protein L11 methylase PrmA